MRRVPGRLAKRPLGAKVGGLGKWLAIACGWGGFVRGHSTRVAGCFLGGPLYF